MATVENVKINIGDVIPNAGKNEADWIVSAWEGANKFLSEVAFRVESPCDPALSEYQVSLDASDLIKTLKNAQQHSGGFAAFLKESRTVNGNTSAALIVTVKTEASSIESYTLYHCVGVFLQQLMLAMNIALPGSCQILDATYEGKDSTSFEPPEFESMVFTNGWLSAFNADWPILKPLKFADVWAWLTERKTSETDTAISMVNKVMFCLLELAQHTQVNKLTNALLVSHMLEMFGKMENDVNHHLLRERIIIILGNPSDKADSFNELYRMKHSLIRSEQPVRRPSMIYHDADDEVLQQLEMHNSPIEQALAIVIALLQDLVINKSACYQYREQVERA